MKDGVFLKTKGNDDGEVVCVVAWSRKMEASMLWSIISKASSSCHSSPLFDRDREDPRVWESSSSVSWSSTREISDE